MNFSFASPYFLMLLLLVPCFIWCREYPKRFYFPKTEWIRKETAWRDLSLWFRILVFALMVLALSQPYLYDAQTDNRKKGRDLVLALDASGSMAQSGFDAKERFKSKYESMVALAKAFTKKRYDDNMGIVLFGTFAYSASPLTYDTEALSFLLDMTDVGLAGESTAIGDAIMQSLRTLKAGQAKSKVVILLTDGFHNSGTNSPKKAVEEAKAQGVKIYTIGIGKKNSYDAVLLEKVAKESGGRHYAALDAKALEHAYEQIDSLEPSPIRSENFLNRRELYLYPLALALLLLTGWTLLQRRRR